MECYCICTCHWLLGFIYEVLVLHDIALRLSVCTICVGPVVMLALRKKFFILLRLEQSSRARGRLYMWMDLPHVKNQQGKDYIKVNPTDPRRKQRHWDTFVAYEANCIVTQFW